MMIGDVCGPEGWKCRWLEGETESETARTKHGALIREIARWGRGRVSLSFQVAPEVESLLYHLQAV